MENVARQPKTGQAKGTVDLHRLKRDIRIDLVARMLDFEINAHGFARCFRPEQHRNGDAKPSLHFFRPKKLRLLLYV